MQEKEEDAEHDITAIELIEAWVDIAYTSYCEDEPSPGNLLPVGEWKNDLRYEGFFHTQRCLVERPKKALSTLNNYREQLGLSRVDSEHPCFVPPDLSEEHRELVVRSKHKRKNVEVGLGKKTRSSSRVDRRKKPSALHHGPSNKRTNKSANRKVSESGKLSESEQETDAWFDIPDEPPQPDHEDDPVEIESSSRDELGGEANVHQLTPKVIGRPGRKEHFTLKQPPTRSSLRLAVNKSLKQKTVIPPPSRLKSKPRRKTKARKLEKAQSRAKQSLNPKRASSVAFAGSNTLVAPDPRPFSSGPAASRPKRGEGDEESGDTLLNDHVPLNRRAGAHAMDVDLEPLVCGVSYKNAWDTSDSELTPLDDEPVPEHTAQFFESPPLQASDAPPLNESGLTTWNDSDLAQYVRIPVWAKSRQELCELPYFKSMQGGVYTRGGTVYGYLLGRFPSPRDAWCHDGRLIVSHGGGKNVMDEGEDPTKAKHQLGDDQLESDKSVRALLTSYRMFRPIVILAEADYEHLQKFNLKQGYAERASYYVLGHYAIVAAWAGHEEVMGQGSIHTRWKFAFQYIEGDQGPPWWLQAPGASIPAPEPSCTKRTTQASGKRRKFGGIVSGNRKRVSEVTTESFTGVPSVDCRECRTLSPRVYTLGPICLNPDCSSFWKLNGLPVSQAGLTFNPDFLVLRGLPAQLQKIPYPIVPEYPDWQYRKTGESIFNRHYWAGACCHRCGRVSCRQKWQCWECLTCGLLRQESRPQIYATSCLFGPMDCETQGGATFSPHDMKSTSRVIEYHDGLNRLVIYYELPDNVGRIVHILNNPRVTHKADQLFQQYQQDASSTNMFQRHAMKTHGVKGELYAQHYSHNAGAPYKYIAEAISTPFEDCPKSVVEAKDYIQYLCEPALGKEVKFNEVLSVAYAEGQEMNFHSDDEPGLGPVIAGLTLGGHAEMLFRYHIACKKNLMYKNGPFRPSEARASDELDSNERVLQIILSHGDLLIMDGTEIQKQYEHAVFVRDTDMVRFAATARLIGPRPSMPTIVRDVHHDAHQAKIYVPHVITWNPEDIPPPFAHQAEAYVPHSMES
ncbi:Melanoma inhibitory activity protein 3 [Rhizoctonia solani]|uniref:Melanoma inhibitory activity protein 3 n=1 Tax=Rhizoctonia solani TaxID=456999 RepID=A0A0K6G804_9AGAM|nr:Melanoma inhibitory activity protein 3 [Rhizoctonia solani]